MAPLDLMSFLVNLLMEEMPLDDKTLGDIWIERRLV